MEESTDDATENSTGNKTETTSQANHFRFRLLVESTEPCTLAWLVCPALWTRWWMSWKMSRTTPRSPLTALQTLRLTRRSRRPAVKPCALDSIFLHNEKRDDGVDVPSSIHQTQAAVHRVQSCAPARRTTRTARNRSFSAAATDSNDACDSMLHRRTFSCRKRDRVR